MSGQVERVAVADLRAGDVIALRSGGTFTMESAWQSGTDAWRLWGTFSDGNDGCLTVGEDGSGRVVDVIRPEAAQVAAPQVFLAVQVPNTRGAVLWHAAYDVEDVADGSIALARTLCGRSVSVHEIATARGAGEDFARDERGGNQWVECATCSRIMEREKATRARLTATVARWKAER